MTCARRLIQEPLVPVFLNPSFDLAMKPVSPSTADRAGAGPVFAPGRTAICTPVVILLSLLVMLFAETAIASPQTTPESAGSVPTMQDPAVPMIELPKQFRSRRVNSDRRIPENGSVDIVNLVGPGCIRHIWLLPGNDVRLVVHVDGTERPQIDMPLKPFFGVMHDLDPYFINCAAYSVLPNPAKGIPGTPGYNLFLPIPFSQSCKISLQGPAGQRAVAMVDWQAYDQSIQLTPYRLHAAHHRYQPAPDRGGFVELADIEGKGFVAGLAMGFIQKNHADMVFHTGGTTLLLDGESEPYAIRGHNVEDDFGFTWGFNDRQTQWLGCPWHVNRGRTDQDGVFYRFFGPDPIAFQSSLLFRSGCRGDDMESVVYYYRIPSTRSPQIRTPANWQAVGLFHGADEWDRFKQTAFADHLAGGSWPAAIADGERSLPVYTITSQRGWIDLQHVFFERHHTATPLTVLNHAGFIRTNLKSERDEQVELQLTIDDWAIVWLNGQSVAVLRHDEGLKTARIAARLRKGDNELLIKTNNTETPPNKRLWAIHLCIKPAGSDGPEVGSAAGEVPLPQITNPGGETEASNSILNRTLRSSIGPKVGAGR